jgi:hypothetical protein
VPAAPRSCCSTAKLLLHRGCLQPCSARDDSTTVAQD